jgi:uncharacterized protein involved in exopolysaccharide biosynthesis
MTGISREEDITVDAGDLLRRLWANRGRVAAVVAIGAVLGIGASLLVAPRFTATASLIPQTPVERGGLIGRLAGLTSLGAELEAGNEAVYGRIITSDTVLDAALDRGWEEGRQAGPLSLYGILGIDTAGDEPDARAREVARRRLRRDVVAFNRDPVTGFMEVRVTLPRHPGIAAALANFLVDRLDEYNRVARSRKAREHREFIEESLDRVAGDLAAAEHDLTAFVEANTSYGTSPRLVQQYNALEREMQAQRSIWLELRTQLESARVDEHKQTPSITVLDPASRPMRRSYPYLEQADKKRARVVHPNGLSQPNKGGHQVLPGSTIMVPVKPPPEGPSTLETVRDITAILMAAATVWLVVDQAAQ